MKRRTKQVFGILGLAGITAMTAYAAVLPNPEASATTQVTDTIQVRVVGSEPEIVATTTEGAQITDPLYDFKVAYENVGPITVTVINRDANGELVSETVIWQADADYVAGEKDFALNLDDYGGAGYYTIKMRGLGYNDVPVERFLTVAYTNVDAEVDAGDEAGDDVTVQVDPPAGTDEVTIEVKDDNDDVVRIIEIDPETGKVTIEDGDGNVIQEIENGYKDGKLDIPMAGLDSGDYQIVITYKDADGNIIGIPYTAEISYTAKATPVPDTGAFFQNLNISKEDYLITGLLIFFVFAVVGFGIVAKSRGDKAKTHAKKRR